jgi:chromosome segregation ATPase
MRDRQVEDAIMRLVAEVSQNTAELRELRREISRNNRNQRWIMKDIDDLKSADDAQTQQLTALTTAVTDATGKIKDLAGQILSATDLATAKQVAQDILDHNTAIAKAASDLEAAVNPPADGGGDSNGAGNGGDGTQTGG